MDYTRTLLAVHKMKKGTTYFSHYMALQRLTNFYSDVECSAKAFKTMNRLA